MLFDSKQKWWGKKGKRERQHEGLDLLLYRIDKGETVHLDETTAIPSIYDGTVIRVIDDFLGKSIFMEHDNGFITAFGHTKPLADIKAGTKIKEGDIIATIAENNNPKIKIAPHLHITAGHINRDLHHESLNWESINNSEIITLLDPLDIIGNSSELENNSNICNDL